MSTSSARGFFTVIARGWAVIVGSALIIGVAGLLYSVMQTPLYEATTTLYITSGTSVVPSAYDAVKASEERIQSYSQLIYSDAVLGPAIKSAKLDMSIPDAKSAVRVEMNPQLVLLTLGARDHNPEVARRLANGIADSMADAVSRLEVPGYGGESTAKISVVTTATVGSSAVFPEIPLNVGISVVLGALVGLGAVLLRERLNDKVRDEADAATALGAPALATVPAAANLTDGETETDSDTARAGALADFAAESDPVATAFRQIRSAVLAASPGPPGRAILVTSARDSDGKTRVALNLGAALAHASHSVVVVDSNIKNPDLATVAGCAAGPGLTDALARATPVADLVQSGVAGTTGLSVLTAGSEESANPDDPVSSAGFRALIGELRRSFDYVVVDSGALLDHPVAKDALPPADEVLVVARRKVSRLSDLRTIGTQLRQGSTGVLGVVLVD